MGRNDWICMWMRCTVSGTLRLMPRYYKPSSGSNRAQPLTVMLLNPPLMLVSPDALGSFLSHLGSVLNANGSKRWRGTRGLSLWARVRVVVWEATSPRVTCVWQYIHGVHSVTGSVMMKVFVK